MTTSAWCWQYAATLAQTDWSDITASRKPRTHARIAAQYIDAPMTAAQSGLSSAAVHPQFEKSSAGPSQQVAGKRAGSTVCAQHVVLFALCGGEFGAAGEFLEDPALGSSLSLVALVA